MKRYIITEKWGQYFITDGDRVPLSADELYIVANKTIAAYELLKQLGSVDAVKRVAQQTELRYLCAESQWLFDVPQKQWKSIKNCVYFMRDPEQPGLIKIGKTSNLSQRMKAFYWNIAFGKYAMEVLAVAVTDNYSDFEDLLHTNFSKDRYEGEWFEVVPVLDLINQMKSEFGDK